MAEKPKARAPASGPSEVVAELAAAGFDNARQIARGAAGVVYCCRETALGRNVAIKVLPTFIDDAGRERFLREGYAMGGLSGHPNIVNILRVGLTPSGRPYIVMSYCPVGSLSLRVQREGPIAWPEATRIGVKLCGALETAHLSGTLHRDIKPANVLVNDYGEPQLTDFGTARIAGGYETAAGLFSGTIGYLAPEVMAGDPATVGSDVYSLGATLYSLIAGHPAYERRGSEDLLAYYTRINSTRVPDLRPGGIPGRGVFGDREGDGGRLGRATDVGGGVRSRIAGEPAPQRLEARRNGHHRRRRRLRAHGGWLGGSGQGADLLAGRAWRECGDTGSKTAAHRQTGPTKCRSGKRHLADPSAQRSQNDARTVASYRAAADRSTRSIRGQARPNSVEIQHPRADRSHRRTD